MTKGDYVATLSESKTKTTREKQSETGLIFPPRPRTMQQICMAIIDVIYAGRPNTTAIMYGASLSYYQVHRYLKFMQAKNLISKNPIKQTTGRGNWNDSYRVTEKGGKWHQLQESADKLLLNEFM